MEELVFAGFGLGREEAPGMCVGRCGEGAGERLGPRASVAIERPTGPTLLAAGFGSCDQPAAPQSAEGLRPCREQGRPEGLLVVGGGGEDPPGCDAPGASGVDRAASGTDEDDGPSAPGPAPAVQRIRNALVDYFPPMLEVASKLKHLRHGKAPTPEAAKKVRLSRWAKLLAHTGGDPPWWRCPSDGLALLQVLGERGGRAGGGADDAVAPEEVGGGPDATEPGARAVGGGVRWGLPPPAGGVGGGAGERAVRSTRPFAEPFARGGQKTAAEPRSFGGCARCGVRPATLVGGRAAADDGAVTPRGRGPILQAHLFPRLVSELTSRRPPPVLTGRRFHSPIIGARAGASHRRFLRRRRRTRAASPHHRVLPPMESPPGGWPAFLVFGDAGRLPRIDVPPRRITPSAGVPSSAR